MRLEPCRLVVLISGNGSNLQSFIDHIERGELHAEIAAVICNRPNALGFDRAAKAGIPTELIDHKAFDSREAFDNVLIQRIDQYTPDLVILAGFMRILTSEFVQRYQGKLLNIHPSLLPKYPGLNTHQRALDAGDSEAGTTVHFVTEELDGGPAILQAKVAIQTNDTAATLAERVLSKEHTIYPQVAQWFAEERLHLKNNRAFFEGQMLPPTGKTPADR